MTKPNHIAAFQSVKESLTNIRKELKPFVRKLDSDNPEEKAQAQSVVALSIGTLRYMGARLRGKDQGRAADDPLRQELDQMRKVLVALEKKRKAREEGLPKKEGKGDTSEKVTTDREGTRTTGSKMADGSTTKRQRRSI
jgi:Skp family chaperone for outer membrane proteins